MRHALLALAALLWATSAFAQPTESRLFRTALIANAVAQAADGVTTWQALQRPGTYEANPAMRWVARSPVQLTLAKAASTAAQTVLLRKLYRRHPKWATGIAHGLTVGVSVIAWRNHQQGRGK